MKRGNWLVLAWLAGCGVVEGNGGDDGPDLDAARADGAPADAPVDAGPLTGADCKAIHAAHPDAPSGRYAIDPDGDGGEAALEVHCDMTTRGGGWTVVFLQEKVENATVGLPYTSATPTLLANAEETLVVFRDAELEPLDEDVVFAMPDAWRQASPFEALDETNDLVTLVSASGGKPIQEKVRYGRALFGSFCEDEWMPGSTFGRFCITRTKGAFYAGWANNGPADFCSASHLAFDAALCSEARRFSIAIR